MATAAKLVKLSPPTFLKTFKEESREIIRLNDRKNGESLLNIGYISGIWPSRWARGGGGGEGGGKGGGNGLKTILRSEHQVQSQQSTSKFHSFRGFTMPTFLQGTAARVFDQRKPSGIHMVNLSKRV
jgi:hypothetical protein